MREALNTCPRRRCRGLTRHVWWRHWLSWQAPAAVGSSWSLAKCKVGIMLKLAGCALIHGRGRHLYRPVHEMYGMSVSACASCGKYKYVALDPRKGQKEVNPGRAPGRHPTSTPPKKPSSR